ncbi:MAG: tetratricopeptide repeat protein [Nitrospiraceae bacterium]
MAQDQHAAASALEIDRLATQLAKDPHSKVFMPLAEEYGKVGMWQEAAGVLEDGLKLYPGFITAMVALGRAYDQMGQATKAKAILEESVKLSPDNLRAHRTLIKIYQSQGLNESALQSCAVILTVNPRDEEARSVQAGLGGPLKHKKEPKRPKPAAPDLTASIVDESKVASVEPMSVEAFLVETGLSSQDRKGERPAIAEQDLKAADTVERPLSLPHVEVVAQLESWLRSIESRRHDRDTTNDPHSKVS